MADAQAPSHTRLARFADYLFGRNTLIGVASLMLLAISGYATWSGMHDFVIGASSTQGQRIPGGLAVNRVRALPRRPQQLDQARNQIFAATP